MTNCAPFCTVTFLVNATCPCLTRNLGLRVSFLSYGNFSQGVHNKLCIRVKHACPNGN